MMKLSTLKSVNVCLFYVLFCPFFVTALSQTNYTKFFPAVIAFGDSILDTGNNNYIETVMKANFKPYGRDFFGGKATGRFSNGRIPSDFIAEKLGIKSTLPPYLDPNLKSIDLLTGVCFASAGSGYDPLTAKLSSVLSIDDQLNMFKQYKAILEAAVGEARTASILAKSLFFVSMGSNDIAMTYFMTPFRKNEYNLDEYTSMLVNLSSNFIQELYELGAIRIGLLSLSPVGCVPLQRTIGGGIFRKCDESINEAAKIYNSKLSSLVVALNRKLSPAKLVYIETYKGFNKIIQNHSKFGFEVADTGCCGVAFCDSMSFNICENATKYVFWDSYHPTEQAYKILVTDMFKKDIHKFV